MRRVNCKPVSDKILFLPHQISLGDNTGAMVTDKPTLCYYQAVKDEILVDKKIREHGTIVATNIKENEGPDVRECVDQIIAEAKKKGWNPHELNYYEQDQDGWVFEVRLNDAKIDGQYPRMQVAREYVQTEIAPVPLVAIQERSGPEQAPPSAQNQPAPEQAPASAPSFTENYFSADQTFRTEAAFEVVAAKKEEYVQKHKPDLEPDLEQDL